MTDSKVHTSSFASSKSTAEGRGTLASALNANGSMIEAASGMLQTYVQTAFKLSEALLGFASSRLKANAKAGEELLRTRSFPDAVRIQQQWLREFSEHYVQEASKLAGLAAQITLKPADTKGKPGESAHEDREAA